jgi:hypothetical protein
MTSFVDSLTQNVFGDLSRQQMLDFEYSVMDLKEKSYAKSSAGPSRLFIATKPAAGQRNSARTVRALLQRLCLPRDKTRRGWRRRLQHAHLRGPRHRRARKEQHARKRPRRVEAVFKAGGSGLVISTSHAAMRPENLSAVGATLRELKLA